MKPGLHEEKNAAIFHNVACSNINSSILLVRDHTLARKMTRYGGLWVSFRSLMSRLDLQPFNYLGDLSLSYGKTHPKVSRLS